MQIKRIIVFILILAQLALLSIYYPRITGEFVKEDYKKESAFATRVIDGDTIIINNNTKVRLLGINTPEKDMRGYGEAKDFLKQIENKSIEILRDSEDIDKYGRKLRYVFYNNQLINIEILKNGMGAYFMIDKLKYESGLKDSEKFAMDNQLGLWLQSRNICAGCINLLELNSTDEFFILENQCGFNCNLTGWIVKDEANHVFKLNSLNAGEIKQYNSKQKTWNNEGDRFFMRDNEGRLVIFKEY